jgi:hypothetical protein
VDREGENGFVSKLIAEAAILVALAELLVGTVLIVALLGGTVVVRDVVDDMVLSTCDGGGKFIPSVTAFFVVEGVLVTSFPIAAVVVVVTFVTEINSHSDIELSQLLGGICEASRAAVRGTGVGRAIQDGLSIVLFIVVG